MLSYLHGFHAGNHADVLKHTVLTLVLEHMTDKDKPFLYLDTHAGAGRYDLGTVRSQKVLEFETGISRLWAKRAKAPAALDGYLQLIADMNPKGNLAHYPGSPWIARAHLREQDRMQLFELHSKEFAQLERLFPKQRRVTAKQSDGFQGLKALLPPVERRAVTLIDPSYEIKTDHRTVVQALADAYKRFSSGVYLLWYPILDRRQLERLERELVASTLRNVLLAELCIAAPGKGMNGSAMVMVNPPWQLSDTLAGILPFLHDVLAGAGGGHRLVQICDE
jgi:23S rRNA (adenine2030-N6)-methyltransferase